VVRIVTEDPLPRARRALQTIPESNRRPKSAAADLAKGEDLFSQARTFAATPSKAPPLSVSTSAGEEVRVLLTCGETGERFVEIAERRGRHLVFRRHELIGAGAGNARRPGLLSGDYVVETGRDWTCPICRGSASANIWMCRCAEMLGAIHCGGAHPSGARYCACGRFEERHLVVTETLQVRGASVAASSPGATQTGAPHGRPQLKRVTHD
jgi:hypothetical protein